MSFNLGFIGGGNMSTALAKGIINSGTHQSNKIWVSGPNIQNLGGWQEMGCHVTDKNGEVFSKCDVIFLGVKPQMLAAAIMDTEETLPEPMPHKKVLFISMLAGKTVDTVREALLNLSTEVSVMRILPNMPVMIGAGCCVFTFDYTVTPAHCIILKQLLGKCCLLEQVPEHLMDSLGSLVGCGPAFIYIVIEALADGAVKQGVPRDVALRIASKMVAGSGMMVNATKKHPGQLKDEVTSPGGTTICGIAVLEEGGIRSSFIKAIEASTKKSQELGKTFLTSTTDPDIPIELTTTNTQSTLNLRP